MQIGELVNFLDKELEAAKFSDGQHNGLQIEGTRPIEKVALAVSVNKQTIELANDWGADTLLTHHGLFWSGEPGHLQGVKRDRVAAIIESGMHLISYHLPLDANLEHGNNRFLADAAGCSDIVPAVFYKGQSIGVSGQLPQATDFARWVEQFEANLRRDCSVATGPFTVWPFGPKQIKHITFCSGAAPHQVLDAINAGADVYVTGETTEPAYHLAKEAGINFIAAGHYLSERGGVKLLGKLLQSKGLEVKFFDVATEA